LRLKEKTHKKFVDFFEKMSKMHRGNEFELAYSDIQRETGAASVTLKRAIQALEADGVIKVNPGRNSRYGRFQFLLAAPEPAEQNVAKEVEDVRSTPDSKPEQGLEALAGDVKEVLQAVDHLRRRVRTQEMAIAILQDRLAELEDKLHKR